MKGHGSCTSFLPASHEGLKNRIFFFGDFSRPLPCSALYPSSHLASSRAQGGHRVGTVICTWARQETTGFQWLSGNWSTAEPEKILHTPTAKTWLTRVVFSNHSISNYYSLKLKAFKEVVVSHPSQSPAQHATCRACSPSLPVWWLKTEAKESGWGALAE